MNAVRLVVLPPEPATAAKPEPGPGEVLVDVGDSTLGHYDLHAMESRGAFPPFTPRREHAGWSEG